MEFVWLGVMGCFIVIWVNTVVRRTEARLLIELRALREHVNATFVTKQDFEGWQKRFDGGA